MIRIHTLDNAEQIVQALPQGILLNTNGDKFNSMVIAWGSLGTIWGLPAFTVYVRQSRYTKLQLDKTGEFSISAPDIGNSLDKNVCRVFGSLSGRDVNKADYVTLTPGRSIHVPAIREYPLTLECRVLYQQDQELEKLPREIRDRFYGHDADLGDFHTAYIGQIVDAYRIDG